MAQQQTVMQLLELFQFLSDPQAPVRRIALANLLYAARLSLSLDRRRAHALVPDQALHGPECARTHALHPGTPH